MIPIDWNLVNCERWFIRNLNESRSLLYDALFVCEYVKEEHKLVLPEILTDTDRAYRLTDSAVGRYVDEYGLDLYLSYVGGHGRPARSLGPIPRF